MGTADLLVFDLIRYKEGFLLGSFYLAPMQFFRASLHLCIEKGNKQLLLTVQEIYLWDSLMLSSTPHASSHGDWPKLYFHL